MRPFSGKTIAFLFGMGWLAIAVVATSPSNSGDGLAGKGAAQAQAQAGPIDYDIVYVRAPRYGDDQMTRWPEVKDPILMEPGADLILRKPDGHEEVLVAGGDGSIVDPYLSYDGEWVYYSRFHDLRRETLNGQRRQAPRAGADIYKLHLPTREVIRLTHQEWTPNTGVANWSEDPLRARPDGTNYLGFGIFNLGPCPLPDGRIAFTSSRNSFLPNKSFTFPNLQLYVMDGDGRNVELVGHMNLGSALHPTLLMDGRMMFSSYEAQGLRDRRIWGLWAMWPDGRRWEPLMSAMKSPSAFHFQTQRSDGDIVVVEYYNQNNNGFGSLLAFPPRPPEGEAPFGSAVPGHASNPAIPQGYFTFPDKPQYSKYSFSPKGLFTLTSFAHGRDNASAKDGSGRYMGKVTHPSGAPDNDILLVWSGGPANHLNRPTNRPVYDGGIYLLEGDRKARTDGDLVKIVDLPEYNEMQPRAVLPYSAIYGIEAPANLPWLPNDGQEHAMLPEGTPFGLVGSSSLYKRDTKPGVGQSRFAGLGPFNTSQNGATSNWGSQGAESGVYADSDIHAVRLLSMEPTSHRSYGPGGSGNSRGYFNHGNERVRILGEIPVRKTDADGEPIMDVDGNPDTSFLARIPADTPFTFQTIDRDGMVLNSSQTWHQLRPGEVRNDCGGCHAHAQVGTDFADTAAARPNYPVQDLSHVTPLLLGDDSGEGGDALPDLDVRQAGAVDVEYYRDIKPILQRSCAGCHTGSRPDPPADLVLDDESIVSGYENTYNRLARDEAAQYGIKPVIKNGTWRQSNASRYIRKFQARRSLLVWKVFGRRLDGFTNADHPSEAVLGDASTLPEGANANDADIDYLGSIMPPPNSGYPPLSREEKLTIARWVDLGAPVSAQRAPASESGWFVDDLRPALTLSSPRAGRNAAPLDEIRFGAFDYYSGLDRPSLSLRADFAVNGKPAGSELAAELIEVEDHVWRLAIEPPIDVLEEGILRLSVFDEYGNVTEIERSFSVGEAGSGERPEPTPTPAVPPGATPSSIAPSPAATSKPDGVRILLPRLEG